MATSTTGFDPEAIKRHVRERLRSRAPTGGAPIVSPATFEEFAPEETHTPPPADPGFFVASADDDASAPDSRVRLSTLVPEWDHKRGTLDPLVTVYERDGYSDAERAQIPFPLDNYRPNQKALALAAYAVESGACPLYLHGLPSVGKTSLLRHLAAITVRPFCRMNFFGNMDAGTAIGGLSLEATADGQAVTVWHDGVIPAAMRMRNAIVHLDEPTAAPAEVQMVLQSALEQNGTLLLADKPGSVADKTIQLAPGAVFTLADNTVGLGDTTGRMVGTSPQNAAWLDRMVTFVSVDWLSQSDESALLRAYEPGATATLTDKITQVATMLRGATDTLSVICSMRVTQAWVKHAVALRSVREGFTLAYLNRIDDESERDAVMETFNAVFGHDHC